MIDDICMVMLREATVDPSTVNALGRVIIGLWFSAALLYFKLLFHVVFHWENQNEYKFDQAVSLSRIWRASYATHILGFLLFSTSALSVLNHPVVLSDMVTTWASLLGLVFLNLGAMIAQTAFCVSHGTKFRVILAVLPIPVAFSVMSLMV